MVRSLTLLSHVTIVYPSPCILPSGSVMVRSYVPEGPRSNDVYSLEYLNHKLYQTHGGHSNFLQSNFNKSGVSIKDKFDVWKNISAVDLDLSEDILSV